MKLYKKVLVAVEVPEGNYCFGYRRICPHFDNEGGYPICNLGFDLTGCGQGIDILKPIKCKDLKEET
jgi:hypothetical protein